MATRLQQHIRLTGALARLRGNNKVSSCSEQRSLLSQAAIFPHKSDDLMLTRDSIAIQPIRFASKKKSKSKSKPKKTSYEEDEDDDEDLPQTVEELVNPEEVRAKFSQIIEDLEVHYADKLKIRTTQGAFNDISVPITKGKSVPIQYLGQISVKPPRTVLVNMTAQPQHLKAALTAISGSPLNVNPRIDGTTIIIETPQVTREHREKLAKQAKMMCDECKNKIRSQLSETMKLLKAGESLFSQDDIKPVSKIVSELATKCMKDSEAVMKRTQARILDS